MTTEAEKITQKCKAVHFNLFRPEKSLFKQSKNERAEFQIITCCNSEKCQLFERKECACRHGLFGGSCPYGKRNVTPGPTQRAMKYHSWCSDIKKRFEGVEFLSSPKSMGVVGDYIFLPYAHMDMKKDFPWVNGSFLKKEDFTIDNILSLIKFRPMAMFGGEITSYQKEVSPLFLKHLSEQMPGVFKQVIAVDEYAAKRYAEFSNIGRKAILETTTPNIGKYKDIHGGLWVWDGEMLKSNNSHASFMLVSKFKTIIIIPEEKQVVTISDESQVNNQTVFIG